MKHSIVFIVTEPNQTYSSEFLRLAAQLAGNESSLPITGEAQGCRYIGYIPEPLIDCKDAALDKLGTVVSGEAFKSANLYIELDKDVDLLVLKERDMFKGAVIVPQKFIAVQTPAGILMAKESCFGEEFPGISIFMDNGRLRNMMALVEYTDYENVCGYDPRHPEIAEKEKSEVPAKRITSDGKHVTPGIIVRAWKAITIPDDDEMDVVRSCPYIENAEQKLMYPHHADESYDALTVETPAGTLVAGAYRDGANCGISINLIKDGRFSTVLHTEYVEDEPFEGDLLENRYGQDVPTQRHVTVADETVVFPGFITRYWTTLDDEDAPAHRVFHF